MLDELQLFSELGVGDWIQAEDWSEEEEGACRRGREGESCFMFELAFFVLVPQPNAAYRYDSAETAPLCLISVETWGSLLRGLRAVVGGGSRMKSLNHVKRFQFIC